MMAMAQNILLSKASNSHKHKYKNFVIVKNSLIIYNAKDALTLGIIYCIFR